MVAVQSEFPSRWSNTGVSVPHSFVTPSTAQDIIQQISYAKANKLKIIPVGGGHGSFVPITDRTIYLSLAKFNSIELNEERGEVTIGGGCRTGDVLKTLAEKGWYTCTVNSNAVGMIGALLGGLNHSLAGKHGLGIDFIHNSPSETSSSLSKPLWDAIHGAGHGFGVITSVTLKAYRISSLELSEGKIWTRRLMFPAAKLDEAVELYLKMDEPVPEAPAVMVFVRAPPTAPVPGAPMIMVSLTYYGPAKDAERIYASTHPDKFAGKAMCTTAMLDWEKMNHGFEALNRHGGFKDYASAFVYGLDVESLRRVFDSWVAFTAKDLKGRGSSYFVVNRSSTAKSIENGVENPTTFISVRDRSFFVQVSPWYCQANEKAEADELGKVVIDAVREKDGKDGIKTHYAFANNWNWGQDVRDVYSEEMIEEIKRTKKMWDPESVGWSPVVDGWPIPQR